MKQVQSDKRVEDRYGRNFGVRMIPFSVETDVFSKRPKKAKGVDVSENGIGVITSGHTRLKKNSPVEMEIRLKGSRKSFNALGFVKWKKKQGKKMHVGIEFYAMYDWEEYKNRM